MNSACTWKDWEGERRGEEGGTVTPRIGFVLRGRWLRSTWPVWGKINGPNGCGCQIGLLLIREEYWL